jgi:hypothetical protein
LATNGWNDGSSLVATDGTTANMFWPLPLNTPRSTSDSPRNATVVSFSSPRSSACRMKSRPSPLSANRSTFAFVAAIRAISGAKSVSSPLVNSLPTTLPPSVSMIGSAASNILCGQVRSAPSRK